MIRRLIPLCMLFAAGSLAAADLTPLDRNTARSLLDPASHKQPTIVALWSSDCSYCKKNLKLLSSPPWRESVAGSPRARFRLTSNEPASPVLGPACM